MVKDSQGILVPKAFVVLGGPKNPDKIKLASNIIWLFTSNQKNSHALKGDCPYLQPSSQAVYI